MSQKFTGSIVSDFAKIGVRERIIIFAVLLCCLFVGFVAVIGLQKLQTAKQPKITVQLSPTPFPPSAKVWLTTENATASVNVPFDVKISLNSPLQGVQAADFVVQFDPNYLTVATVSAGTYFKTYPVNETSDHDVKLSGVAYFADNKLIVPKGQGTVGTITFTPIAATDSSAIQFDRVKTIVANGGVNIIKEINDLVIKIQ